MGNDCDRKDAFCLHPKHLQKRCVKIFYLLISRRPCLATEIQIACTDPVYLPAFIDSSLRMDSVNESRLSIILVPSCAFEVF